MKRDLPSGLRVPFIALVLALLILLPGCGSEVPSSDATIKTDSVETTATTAAVSGRKPTIKSIADDVSAIRGLPVKKEITVDYKSRDQMRDEVKQQIDKEYPQADLAREERALKTIGLMDPQENLLDEIVKMLGEETAGYYDDETKQLVVVSDTPVLDVMNEVILSHEITHALQDQNFDLAKIAPSGNTQEDDKLTAQLSLVEGDATIAMQEYAQSKLSVWDELGLGLGALGDAGGTYMEDSLSFPYTYGAGFVSYLKKQGGWKMVDSAYSRLPDSTEQIMHPEKYIAGERPAAVELPDVAGIAGPGWELVEDGTVGEFDVLELLLTQLNGGTARRAAAGWGGGVARYYEDAAGRPLLVMNLAWDSQPDADEFAEAVATCLEDRYGASFDFSGQWPNIVTGDGSWVVEENGAGVAVVLSPGTSLSGQVADKMVGLEGGNVRQPGAPNSVMVSCGN